MLISRRRVKNNVSALIPYLLIVTSNPETSRMKMHGAIMKIPIAMKNGY
jgi:hypothetical protein